MTDSLGRCLVIGACGQIGTALGNWWAKTGSNENILMSDLFEHAHDPRFDYVPLNVLDVRQLSDIVRSNGINTIVLLAAKLSAAGEVDPHAVWHLNMDGLLNVLNEAKASKLRVFWPSSIAVFGPATQRIRAEQSPCLDPATVYGISKLAGERWCSWYRKKYGVDVRSVRFPGLISPSALTGCGTTDYAVEIFHAAAAGRPYTCYLEPDCTLPMMYITDAVRAMSLLMRAPTENLHQDGAYNIGAMSFSPAELTAMIRQRIPHFQVRYEPDYRQVIAQSWPKSINDEAALADWFWEPLVGASEMVDKMLMALGHPEE